MGKPTSPRMTNQERLATFASYALPVLLDRAGGEVTVSVTDLEATKERHGGRILIEAEEVSPGTYRLWLVKPEPEAEEPPLVQ